MTIEQTPTNTTTKQNLNQNYHSNQPQVKDTMLNINTQLSPFLDSLTNSKEQMNFNEQLNIPYHKLLSHWEIEEINNPLYEVRKYVIQGMVEDALNGVVHDEDSPMTKLRKVVFHKIMDETIIKHCLAKFQSQPNSPLFNTFKQGH